MALNALNPINLNKLIVQLASASHFESIERIKNDYIKFVENYYTSRNFKSIEEMYLMALSLDLPDQASNYISKNLNSLLSLKIVIETLKHLLEKPLEGLDKLLDAIIPLISNFILKSKNKIEIDAIRDCIGNNDIKWKELTISSVKFAELNLYCNCSLISVEKYMIVIENIRANSGDELISNYMKGFQETTSVFKWLDSMYQVKSLNPIDYLKIIVMFCSKNKVEKEIEGWISNYEILKTNTFFPFILTCLEFCGRCINLRELLYGFVSKLILKRSEDLSIKTIIDDKIRGAIIAEVNMGGLSINADDINFKDFTVPHNLRNMILDFHDAYYFLRLIAIPSVQVFEQVKKFKWFEIEKKRIFSCLLETGADAISILMNDRHGAASILDKLQHQILIRQVETADTTGCDEIIKNLDAVRNALTNRAIVQPNAIDGIAGLFSDMEAPFIRISKYLLSLSIYLNYLQFEVPITHRSAIFSLKSSIDAFVESVYVMLDSNSAVRAMLNIVTNFDVQSFSAYSKECSNFDAITKNKVIFALDALIIHAAQRIMSPSQRIAIFKTLVHLCKDESISNEIQCLATTRRMLTLGGTITGDVIRSKATEAKNIKVIIDECGPLIDELINLIKEEGSIAAVAIEEVISSRPISVLKKLFDQKADLFSLLLEHVPSLEALKTLFDMKVPDNVFSGEGYVNALTKCPVKWKVFFNEISASLFSKIFNRYTLPEEEERGRMQTIQILKMFSAYQPESTDKTLFNTLVKLEDTIKGNQMLLASQLPKAFSNYRSGDFNPSKLIYFNTFVDIIFFRNSTDVAFLLSKVTNGNTASQVITQYKSIWASFTTAPTTAIFFDYLKTLWFRVLDHMVSIARIDAGVKRMFEEFVAFFNTILNGYSSVGSAFWSNISVQSVKRVSKKQTLKKIVQNILVIRI